MQNPLGVIQCKVHPVPAARPHYKISNLLYAHALNNDRKYTSTLSMSEVPYFHVMSKRNGILDVTVLSTEINNRRAVCRMKNKNSSQGFFQSQLL